MKTLAKWMLITGLLGMILAGCGTSQTSGDSTNGTAPTNNVDDENQNADDQDAGESQGEKGNSEDNAEENKDGVVRILEQNIQYKVNGETKEETAFLKNNDNQHYSMYVLPDYELTAEEPNKDILFLAENDQVFMRIELLPDDVEWSLMEETTKSQLEAVNEEVETIEAPSDEFFQSATVMEASTDEETVTAYLIKNKKQPLKLTIFTKSNLDVKDAFVQMAKTIMKEKAE
ncbi:hypothetical protein BGM26_01240 [Bacillus sp. FJAT-29790]|uniref:hypothetical protein n=1 Tax=Bacillus sp. FJAT-29790 TaxID=1895002 RepID=UPI001C21A65B|nr:hypothetical protein [Bacillus sp. FJAT-29790]MBU8877611.1 hypothetical protein [Bacillus sp. FJAT-29790]